MITFDRGLQVILVLLLLFVFLMGMLAGIRLTQYLQRTEFTSATEEITLRNKLVSERLQ